MSCPVSAVLGQNLTFTLQSYDAAGAPVDCDTLPAYNIYEASTDTEILSGSMAKLADAATTGFYAATIAVTSANGFELWKNYTIRIVSVIGGVTVAKLYSFLATAEASLLADTSSAGLCTLADIKERVGIAVTDYDTALGRIIEGINTAFDNYVLHPLLVTAADVTEYYTGCGPALQLRRFPVVAVTSIKESYDYDFDDDDSLLTADEDYRIIAGGRFGIIQRIYADWLNLPDSIQVVGRGGYCAAGVVPGEREFDLPSDLREAATEQTSFIWKRKDDLGLSSVSAQGGSISKFADMDLLPMVKRILDKYRIPSL